MRPATRPPERRSDARLLAIDPRRATFHDAAIDDLPALLAPGDLLVVNDAATLPASLPGRGPAGEAIELRLAASPLDGRAHAVLFGAGEWRTPTEARPPPPPLPVGATLHLGDPNAPLRATLLAFDPRAPRLVEVAFEPAGAALWGALYAAGRPVQYSYLADDLHLGSVQTAFAATPWAVEMPSAGRPLAWSTLLALRRAGVRVAALTHAAGLSSTGDPALDALLPLPERYAIPHATVAAIAEARARGGRIIAAGTTVVRALEGCVAARGRLIAGEGVTDLRIETETTRHVVDAILTGMHGPGESHHELLTAFAPRGLLLAAWRHAADAGYLAHEFGDATLILPDLPRAASAAA